MATIVEKTETDGMINRFVLVGAGKVPASFGDQEEDFLVACDEEGCVQILNDYKCTLRIVSIDGKSPKELLNDFSGKQTISLDKSKACKKSRCRT